MNPIPVGSIVEYTGSGPWGYYVVTAHADPVVLFPAFNAAELEAAYPDGVAYEIWPEGVEQRFGNRHLMLWRVRRTSLTLKGEPGG